jgi:hypothetical protein|tara:strand:+ start:121 stop:339 length:219 start_codon:yes stop_codon:yes gene_type:complete
MIEGIQVIEIWQFFREYMDRKQPVEVIAEKFVDLMADYGVSDEDFQDALGADDDLDKAIQYYLDTDSEEEDY